MVSNSSANGNRAHRAALGGLIGSLLLFASVDAGLAKAPLGVPLAQSKDGPSQPTPPPPNSAQQKPSAPLQSCGQAPDRILSTECAEIRSAEAAEDQAESARKQVTAGILQILGLIGSILLTAFATRSAAVAAWAATKATMAIPILERAYPYVVIKSSNAEVALQLAATSSQAVPKDAPVKVSFVVKNYGKTPATILDITAETYIYRPQLSARDVQSSFFPQEIMLGEGGETEILNANMTENLHADDYLGVCSGTHKLYFSGWVTYRDVWGEDSSAHFRWYYSTFHNAWITTLHLGEGAHESQNRPPVRRAGPIRRWLAKWQHREKSVA